MNDNDKQELIGEIRNWIQMDEQIKDLQKQIRQIKQEKKQVTNTLVDIMRTNEIGEINTGNGKLIYSQQKVKKSISKKYLTGILAKFFQNDPGQAKELGQFILNNREETVRENIKRKINK